MRCVFAASVLAGLLATTPATAQTLACRAPAFTFVDGGITRATITLRRGNACRMGFRNGFGIDAFRLVARPTAGSVGLPEGERPTATRSRARASLVYVHRGTSAGNDAFAFEIDYWRREGRRTTRLEVAVVVTD